MVTAGFLLPPVVARVFDRPDELYGQPFFCTLKKRQGSLPPRLAPLSKSRERRPNRPGGKSHAASPSPLSQASTPATVLESPSQPTLEVPVAEPKSVSPAEPKSVSPELMASMQDNNMVLIDHAEITSPTGNSRQVWISAAPSKEVKRAVSIDQDLGSSVYGPSWRQKQAKTKPSRHVAASAYSTPVVPGIPVPGRQRSRKPRRPNGGMLPMAAIAQAARAEWIIPEEPEALREKVLDAIGDALTHEELREDSQKRVMEHVDSAMSLPTAAEVFLEDPQEPEEVLEDEDPWQRQISQLDPSPQEVHYATDAEWDLVAAQKVLAKLFMRVSLKRLEKKQPKPPAAPPPSSKRPVPVARQMNSPTSGSDASGVHTLVLSIAEEEAGHQVLREEVIEEMMARIVDSALDEEDGIDIWTRSVLSAGLDSLDGADNSDTFDDTFPIVDAVPLDP